MSKFSHDADDDAADDDARAMTIPQRFLENSRAKNKRPWLKLKE